MVERLGIASLNYECVLEVAAERCGLDVIYEAERCTRSTLPSCKPHGPCNWFAKGWEIYNAGVDLRLVHFDTDGSERADAPVLQGARLASMSEARLGLLYVIDTGRPFDQGDELRPEEALARATVLAEKANVTPDARIVSGDPTVVC